MDYCVYFTTLLDSSIHYSNFSIHYSKLYINLLPITYWTMYTTLTQITLEYVKHSTEQKAIKITECTRPSSKYFEHGYVLLQPSSKYFEHGYVLLKPSSKYFELGSDLRNHVRNISNLVSYNLWCTQNLAASHLLQASKLVSHCWWLII